MWGLSPRAAGLGPFAHHVVVGRRKKAAAQFPWTRDGGDGLRNQRGGSIVMYVSAGKMGTPKLGAEGSALCFKAQAVKGWVFSF